MDFSAITRLTISDPYKTFVELNFFLPRQMSFRLNISKSNKFKKQNVVLRRDTTELNMRV